MLAYWHTTYSTYATILRAKHCIHLLVPKCQHESAWWHLQLPSFLFQQELWTFPRKKETRRKIKLKIRLARSTERILDNSNYASVLATFWLTMNGRHVLIYQCPYSSPIYTPFQIVKGTNFEMNPPLSQRFRPSELTSNRSSGRWRTSTRTVDSAWTNGFNWSSSNATMS